MLDMMVTNPAGRSFRVYNQVNAVTRDLFAATLGETRKRKHYAGKLEGIQGEFVPFVVEATGRMGTAAMDYINSVIPFPQEFIDRGLKAPIDILQAQLCSAVMKGNATIIRRRLRLSRVVGHTVQAQ